MNGFALAIKRAVKAEAFASGPQSTVHLPVFLVTVSGLVLVVNVAMSFWGSVASGISTDEPIHVWRLQNWIDFGSYGVGESPPPQMSSDASQKIVFAYGPVMALIGHLFASGIGQDAWLTFASVSAEAYAARHVGVALIGLLGIVAVAGIARLMFQSWRWAVLAGAVLSSIPLWTGHSMFNMKDVPAASGFSLATFGLILLARPNDLFLWRNGLIAFAAITLGTCLAIGTRPGIWPALGIGALVMLTLTYWVHLPALGQAQASLLLVLRLTFLAGASLLSYASLRVIYPRMFLDPVAFAQQSVLASANFDVWSGWTITAGVTHYQPPPWWYIPVWLVNQIPFGLFLFACIGVGGIIFWLLPAVLRRQTTTVSPVIMIGVPLVLIQAVLVPVGFVIFNSPIYSGLRQLLFIVPALALLVVFGIWCVFRRVAKTRGPHRALASGVGIVAGVSLLVPTVDQARLFPFNYSYYNEIATLKPVNGTWATDYWQTSFRELETRIPQDGRPICEAVTPSADCAIPLQMAPFRTSDEGGAVKPEEGLDGYYLVTANEFGIDVPSNCRLLHEVKRPLRHQQVTMSYLALCDS